MNKWRFMKMLSKMTDSGFQVFMLLSLLLLNLLKLIEYLSLHCICFWLVYLLGVKLSQLKPHPGWYLLKFNKFPDEHPHHWEIYEKQLYW